MTNDNKLTPQHSLPCLARVVGDDPWSEEHKIAYYATTSIDSPRVSFFPKPTSQDEVPYKPPARRNGGASSLYVTVTSRLF